MIEIGQRVPKNFFVTSGSGQSDITVHAGSYHLALRSAGIEMCNIMQYSSILPPVAKKIERPPILAHGAVMETIMACYSAKRGRRVTAGIIYGWLRERGTQQPAGGLVSEYSGKHKPDVVREKMQKSLMELYNHGFQRRYELTDIHIEIESFVVEKKYGTAIVALCFTDYLVPIISKK